MKQETFVRTAKLRNEVATLNRLNNESYETRDKALRLLKELVRSEERRVGKEC